MLQSDSFKNSPIGKIFIEATDDDEEADEFDVEDNHVDGVPSSADEAKIMEISEEVNFISCLRLITTRNETT